MTTEKRTERLTLWLPESLYLDLSRMAHDDDRKLGDFVTLALSRYAYGHHRCSDDLGDVAKSGEERK